MNKVSVSIFLNTEILVLNQKVKNYAQLHLFMPRLSFLKLMLQSKTKTGFMAKASVCSEVYNEMLGVEIQLSFFHLENINLMG